MGVEDRPRPRAWPTLVLLAVLALAAFAGLASLGTWQLHRRVWKLDLIAHVQQRVHARPAPAPGPDAWPAITAERDAYRRVRATGVLQNDKETLVQAVTALGPGFWVMTPLRTDRGFTVLINRGFVPPEQRDPSTRKAGELAGQVAVTGLLRVTEPNGAFLRHNDPAEGRWYSRDVAAIAGARGLHEVAPYFIDADATSNPGGSPVGGLTVIAFPNSHLVYAITWFTLAVMVLAGAGYVAREEWRMRRRRDR